MRTAIKANVQRRSVNINIVGLPRYFLLPANDALSSPTRFKFHRTQIQNVGEASSLFQGLVWCHEDWCLFCVCKHKASIAFILIASIVVQYEYISMISGQLRDQISEVLDLTIVSESTVQHKWITLWNVYHNFTSFLRRFIHLTPQVSIFCTHGCFH